MRDDILLEILFQLFRREKVTATELAEKYSLSPRTVYRYLRRLSPLLPLEITRGRAGGVSLAKRCRLPAEYLTQEEYAATVEALSLAYSQTAEPRFLTAKRKLTKKQE